MAMFYFDVTENDAILRDCYGVSLQSPECACDEAVKLSYAILSDGDIWTSRDVCVSARTGDETICEVRVSVHPSISLSVDDRPLRS